MMDDKSCKTSRWRLLKAELNNLSANVFLQKIQSVDHPVIIDVRTANEFATGHLNGAINISYLADNFWEEITAQKDPSKDFFIYCRSGRRSLRACTLMRNGGFNNERVFNLDVGYPELLVNLESPMSKL